MAKRGDNVGPWQLIELLRRGGQGQVWAARKIGEESAERVALKLLKTAHPKKRSRFIQEVKIHESLSRDGVPNVIPILDHNLDELQDGGVSGYIVMPEAAGSLADFASAFLDRPDICLEVLAGILTGLTVAHERGVVHRDLKPANILFLDIDLREPLIADFGICLLRETPSEDRVTEVGETVGAKFFMAPEQERGGVADVSSSADIYALGKLLHNMITGKLIYREEVEVAFSPVALEEDARLRRIQEEILLPTVLHDPEERIQTASDLLVVVTNMRKQFTRVSAGQTVHTESLAQVRSGEDGEGDSELESESTELPDLRESYRSVVERLVDGQIRSVEFEFDGCREQFQDAWDHILARIESSPELAEPSARALVFAQPRIAVLTASIARTDAVELYPTWKRFIESVLSATQGRSGHPAVLGVPNVLCGFVYMLGSVVAYSNENWKILGKLLNRPFEWQYRSGKLLFSPGFSLPYLFHPEALGRGSNKAHDLYRELLGSPRIVQITHLEGDALLNTYLQVQFLMTMKAVQLHEAGEGAAVWPDYGRFYANRLDRLLYRIEGDQEYASRIGDLFGESAEVLRERLPDRMSVPPSEWFGGTGHFWDSHTTWDFGGEDV